MTLWFLRRLLQAGFVVLAMTIIVFSGLHFMGNPIDVLISAEATQDERARMITQLGLDQPLWRQYLAFLSSALEGNLGNSFVFNLPAVDLILQRMPATLELAFLALLLALLIGIPLGLYAGLYPNSGISRIIMTGSILGFSLPTFWVGLMMIMLFSVYAGWLPSSGRGETITVLGVEWSFLTWDGFKHLILPALNLALFKISMVLRLTRAGVSEVVMMDYIKFARAKGLSPTRIIGVHVMKNIMIPVVTVIGLEFGSMIAFSVVTESVFAYPGMGKLLIDSINVMDRPVIVSYLVVIVVIFVTINMIIDLLYYLLDPRLRHQEAA